MTTTPSGKPTVLRHLVWVCAGCEQCQEPSTDGVTPGAPIPHDTPCTDTSPSMNGMVVVAAEDYDRLAALTAARRPEFRVVCTDADGGTGGWSLDCDDLETVARELDRIAAMWPARTFSVESRVVSESAWLRCDYRRGPGA